jgi:hypothetical protein
VKASGLDAARWYTLLVVAVSVVGPVAGYFLMPLLAWL